MAADARLIIASNRLPVAVTVDDNGVAIRPSSGGLVTAMEPILSKASGVWIGWCGIAGTPPGMNEAINQFSQSAGFALVPVPLDEPEIDGFYRGFSNSIIWPLFHDLQSFCDFKPEYWQHYRKIADRFAAAVDREASESDIIWIHDYHLIGVGRRLKALGRTNRCVFFLHTPFPPADIFLKLPWRAEMLEELLAYDLIGFQTMRDLKNFADTYNTLTGQHAAFREGQRAIAVGDRHTVAGAFPIAIDFSEFDEQARMPEIVERAAQIRTESMVASIILSVDRLDYTKGIPNRIEAFRRLLSKYPDLRKQVVLMQIVVPSRAEVDQYQQLKASVERLVTEVNGEFGEVGWTPVQHFFRSITREELLALYLAADIALVTPLKDGMNLVCKEYCVSRHDLGGRLVLSEFAGAAEELGRNALLVNPYDIDGVADALYSALQEPPEKKRAAMEALREGLLQRDVFAWARSVLETGGIPGAAGLLGYPEHETVWSRLWKKILFE